MVQCMLRVTQKGTARHLFLVIQPASVMAAPEIPGHFTQLETLLSNKHYSTTAQGGSLCRDIRTPVISGEIFHRGGQAGWLVYRVNRDQKFSSD